MQKLELYAELFLRWVALLICLPLTVAFFLFYTLGLSAEYFFTWLFSFVKSTRNLITDQSEINEPKTTT
jgi:hypothetical protein